MPQSSLDAVKALLGNPTLLQHLQVGAAAVIITIIITTIKTTSNNLDHLHLHPQATGEITPQQIAQLQQLLPGAPPAPPAPLAAPQFPGGGAIPGLGGGHAPAPPAFQQGGAPPGQWLGAPPPGFAPHQAAPPGFLPPLQQQQNQFGHTMGLDARLAMGAENFSSLRAAAGGAMAGFGLPRASPLEEGEHAGDTDDDVMMVDEVAGGGRGRRDVGRGRRSRSRSDSRGKKGKRRRSKSRSRSRDRGGRRKRSRSREGGYRERTSERDREVREREREEEKRRVKEEEVRNKDREEDRKKKGLPGMREGHMTVCSTTLWVGHLSKLVQVGVMMMMMMAMVMVMMMMVMMMVMMTMAVVMTPAPQEDDLSDNFGTYGEITSIDLIQSRGCAFVCMNRRMDAFRSLSSCPLVVPLSFCPHVLLSSCPNLMY